MIFGHSVVVGVFKHVNMACLYPPHAEKVCNSILLFLHARQFHTDMNMSRICPCELAAAGQRAPVTTNPS